MENGIQEIARDMKFVESSIDGGADPCPACSARLKERPEKEVQDLSRRLRIIEGQIRGIRGMVERNAYCPEILTQVSAAGCALNSFTKVLLASHVRTCVREDILAGHDEAIDELVDLLQKLMK